MTHSSPRDLAFPLLRSLVIACVLLSATASADLIFGPQFGETGVREMLRQERYAEVVELAEARLAESPADGEQHAVLAYARAGLGEWEAAERAVLRAIELAPADARDELRVLQAEILLGLGDAAEAERQLRAVLTRDARNVSALLQMGVLYRRTGDGIRSTEHFERVLRVDPGHETALRALYETYLARADYDAIARLSRTVPDDSPARALGHYFDGLAAVRRNPPDYAGAAASLRKAVATGSPSPEMLSTLGWVLLRDRQLDEAASALIEAVNLAPDYFEAQRLLGVVLLQAGQPNLAAGHLEQALAIRDTAELRQLLARAYQLQGRGEAVIAQLLASAESADLSSDEQAGLQGLYRYVGGDFAASETSLRAAIVQQPGAPHLKFLLIATLLKQQQFEAAAREARQAASAHPDDSVLALNFLALAKLGSGEVDEAEAALRDALDIDPAARTTRVNLSTVYVRSGQLAKAQQALNALLDESPADNSLRVRLARVLQAAQDLPGAERVLLAGDGSTPKSNALLRELFLLKARAGDYASALTYAAAMVANYPRLFEGYLLRARAYAALGRRVEADDSINAGFRAAGETQGALAAAASLARVNGWHDRAVDYLRRHEAQFGLDDPTLVKLYALELIETGDTDEARAVLRAKLGATDPNALFLAARSYIADGNQALAEEHIDAALAAGIAPAVIERQRAELATAVRLDELRADLDGDDDDPLRYQALAGAHEMLGDLGAAIEVYRGGIGKTAQDSLFRLQVARLLYKQGDTQASIDAARAVLDDGGLDAETSQRAYAVLGMSYAAQGEPDAAERALEQATGPGSRVAEAHYRLAQIRAERGEFGDAARLLRSAIAIAPTVLRHYFELAGIYQRQGDLPGSIRTYEEGLAAVGDSVPLLNDLSLAQLVSGDRDAALASARKALALAPDDARVLDTLGQIHLQGRDPRAAIPYLERAVDRAPESSLYRFHLGISYFEAGARDRAKAELEEALARQTDAPWAGEIQKVLRAIGES